MDHHTNVPNIIFIGGTGRSGTNITKEIFQKHPVVASLPFEYRFIIDPDGLVDFYCSYTAAWSPYLADRKIKRLERLLNVVASDSLLHKVVGNLLRYINPNGKVISRHCYHRWELEKHLPNFQKHSQMLIDTLKDFSFSASWVGTESYVYHPRIYYGGPKTKEELSKIFGRYICQIISDLLEQENKQFFVEDNTWNILFARELLEFLPTAKILHIYRDPRDVVVSLMHQRWAPSTVKETALWYNSIISHWFSIRTTLPAGSYLECRLEDLVNHPERTLRAICQFTEIPYDDILLETDLSRSHAGRWKRELPQKEQNILQTVLDKVITQLGYQLD